MSKLEMIKKDALSEAQATPGITRHLAFKGEDLMILRARSDPGVVSGWHHHGDYDVYVYVVSGQGRLETERGQGDSITAGPGDFFHVPAHTVHREINPSQSEANEMILFLRGSGPLVFNMNE